MPVYFAQAGEGGAIKIGFASNVSRRMSALRVACPTELLPLAQLDGGIEIERGLHERFRLHRIVGEWFEPTEELLALVATAEPIVSRRQRSTPSFGGGISTSTDLINALGGNQPVAALFGVEHNTVSTWRTRGFPAWVCAKLQGAAEKASLECDSALFEIKAPYRNRAA